MAAIALVFVALLGALVMGGGPGANLGSAAALEGLGASFHLVFIVIAARPAVSLLFLLRTEEKPLRGAPPPAQP